MGGGLSCPQFCGTVETKGDPLLSQPCALVQSARIDVGDILWSFTGMLVAMHRGLGKEWLTQIHRESLL